MTRKKHRAAAKKVMQQPIKAKVKSYKKIG
jgi:hypothetical protein